MAAYKGHRMNPDKFEKGQIKLYLFVVPLALITGLPIVYIIFHAFKPMEELFAFPPKSFVLSLEKICTINSNTTDNAAA